MEDFDKNKVESRSFQPFLSLNQWEIWMGPYEERFPVMKW